MTSILPISDSEKLQQCNRELAILNRIAEAINRSVYLEQAIIKPK